MSSIHLQKAGQEPRRQTDVNEYDIRNKGKRKNKYRKGPRFCRAFVKKRIGSVAVF